MADSSDQSDCSSDRIPPDEVLADVQAERHQTLWGVVHGGLCATVIENVAPAGAVADRAAPRTHAAPVRARRVQDAIDHLEHTATRNPRAPAGPAHLVACSTE